MIGNADDARFICDWYIGQLSTHDRYDVGAPKGWVRLGSGCYRAAFVSPDGVVYKVQHRRDAGAYGNAGEAQNLRRYWLTKMPKGCRLPRYRLFELGGEETVIAMERFSKLLTDVSRYQSPGDRYWALKSALENVMYDLYDLHGRNVAIDEENNLLVPIDLGG